jgi:molecular chaperone GrpE
VNQDGEKPNTIEALDGQSAGDSIAGDEGQVLKDLQLTLQAKIDEYKGLHDKYLRQAAEFENYKRLSQREQRDQIRFGNEQLLKELLPVVDNLERALVSARQANEGDGLVKGVDLTLKQLLGALAKFGVNPIQSVGQPFDPASHQAVAHVPSDKVPVDSIVEEFQKGYKLHDRILRAAMVTVSAGPARTTGPDGAEVEDLDS